MTTSDTNKNTPDQSTQSKGFWNLGGLRIQKRLHQITESEALLHYFHQKRIGTTLSYDAYLSYAKMLEENSGGCVLVGKDLEAIKDYVSRTGWLWLNKGNKLEKVEKWDAYTYTKEKYQRFLQSPAAQALNTAQNVMGASDLFAVIRQERQYVATYKDGTILAEGIGAWVFLPDALWVSLKDDKQTLFGMNGKPLPMAENVDEVSLDKHDSTRYYVKNHGKHFFLTRPQNERENG